ncbi:MAG: hypothetical protein ACFE9C_11830, partial [Candidatus Hodarchaeota archaeon]
MEQVEQEVEEIIEIRKKRKKSIFTYIKFLLIPGYIDPDLITREFEYEKTISKRKFIRRLKSPLTLLGIGIIFVIVSLTVFCPWISPQSLRETVDFYPNPV